MEFQPLLDQVAAKPSPFMNNESLKKAGTFGPAYLHESIVEMRESVYDESPIGLAGERCDDGTRWTTMASNTNTAQRSRVAINCDDLLAQISGQRHC
jgi:hypothetical protein